MSPGISRFAATITAGPLALSSISFAGISGRRFNPDRWLSKRSDPILRL